MTVKLSHAAQAQVDALKAALVSARRSVTSLETQQAEISKAADAWRTRAERAERLAWGLFLGTVLAAAIFLAAGCSAAGKQYDRPPARVIYMDNYDRWQERTGDRAIYKCLDGYALCKSWGTLECMCVPHGTPAILTPRGTWR
jgi:hypothetical protein